MGNIEEIKKLIIDMTLFATDTKGNITILNLVDLTTRINQLYEPQPDQPRLPPLAKLDPEEDPALYSFKEGAEAQRRADAKFYQAKASVKDSEFEKERQEYIWLVIELRNFLAGKDAQRQARIEALIIEIGLKLQQISQLVGAEYMREIATLTEELLSGTFISEKDMIAVRKLKAAHSKEKDG